MGTWKTHNVRFYEVEPRAIHCMAYETNNRKLALSRADSSLETWDMSYTPHIERTIPGQVGGSVEALVWCNDRLFSTGLQGMVMEYNLFSLSVKMQVPVISGPSWCLDINKQKTHLAAGTEDGLVNIFEITKEGFSHEKVLDKQEGRILCIAWDATGNFIVTGSIDALRVWNVHTGHAVHMMTTGRSENKKDTIVWCVAVMDDFTIVSGDSRGKTSFWNGHNGTQIESIQSHKADVLCLCLNSEKSEVYSSGVDPLIVNFVRVNTKPSGEEKSTWMKSFQRRIHEHDVRALALCNNKLASGGVDGYLAISYHPPKTLLKYPPIPQPPCVCLATKSRCIMLRFGSYLQVWKLGEAAVTTEEEEPGSVLPLAQDLVKLLELRSKRDAPIVCCSISSNGCWIGYSTETLIRFFSFSMNDEVPHLQKVCGVPKDCAPAQVMIFTPDSKKVITATKVGTIQVLQMDTVEPVILHTFQPHTDKILTDTIHLLAVANDGKCFAAADHSSNIAVWQLDKWKHVCTLPKYKCEPTAMGIQPHTMNLIVVYADQKIVEYSLGLKLYTDFSRNLDDHHPRQWLSRQFAVTSITFDPRSKNVFILHDDSTICIINKNKIVGGSEHPSRLCKLCNGSKKKKKVEVKMKNRNTSGLKKHLLSVHKNESQKQVKQPTADIADFFESAGQVTELPEVEAKIPRIDPTLNDTVGSSSQDSVHPEISVPTHAFHVCKKYKHIAFVGWLGSDEMVVVEVSPASLMEKLPPTLKQKRFGM